MAHYRCYSLDGQGKIVKSEDIEAESDEAALAIARELMAQQGSHGFELWRGRQRLFKGSRCLCA